MLLLKVVAKPGKGFLFVLQYVLYFLLALLFLSSFGVWVHIATKLRAGKPPLPFREREPAERDPVVFALTLFYVVWMGANAWLAGSQTQVAEMTVDNVQTSCLSNAIIIGVIASLLLLTAAGRLFGFGMTANNFGLQLKDGCLGFAASFLPVVAVLLLTLPLRDTEKQHPFLQLLGDDPSLSTIAWIFLAVVVLAPLAEELIFRVVLQGWLQTWISPGWAIAIVAVLFVGIHRWPDVLPLFPLALILGYLYYRRYSYWSVVVLHSLFNGSNLLIAVLSE